MTPSMIPGSCSIHQAESLREKLMFMLREYYLRFHVDLE